MTDQEDEAPDTVNPRTVPPPPSDEGETIPAPAPTPTTVEELYDAIKELRREVRRENQELRQEVGLCLGYVREIAEMLGARARLHVVPDVAATKPTNGSGS
jgi:hypothetical protein